MEKYIGKKIKSQQFNKITEGIFKSKLQERCSDCGGFLMFLADSTMEKTKLHNGDFCKNRFCPMCSWRKARKDTVVINILMKHLREEHNKEFIFLTLTTPNVSGEQLNEEIKKYNNAFRKLMKRTEVLNITKGYIRKLEVTYQKSKYITKKLYKDKQKYYDKRGLQVGSLEPNYNTYNPHFHVVIAVNKSYFKKGYITQKRWLELWQEATGDSSITQVNVKKAKHGDDNKDVYELAKYSAKDEDYLVSKKVFKIFYEALKGKQLLVFSGLFKEALKLFKAGELDKYKIPDTIKYIFMMCYVWENDLKEYEEYHIRKLDPEELEKYNNLYIDEFDID